MKSIELFSGIGGLSMGVQKAGFNPLVLMDIDKYANDTLLNNVTRNHPIVKDWSIKHCDIERVDWKDFPSAIDLLTAGPPCQPFSIGGKHKFHGDPRDMFSTVTKAICSTQPKAFLIENVKGLTRRPWKNYLSYIHLQLSFPTITRKDNESWEKHLRTLEQHRTSTRYFDLKYNVVYRLVNTANYGIPQQRERIFFIGFRNDINAEWSFPEETHSELSLFRDQYLTAQYWEKHNIPYSQRPDAFYIFNQKSKKFKSNLDNDSKLPWRTIRDAICDLPEPSEKIGYPNHVFRPGARPYPGHSGSKLDYPSKTLKAGKHGVPGGENMLVSLDNKFRYFTIRESARLQTFPDDFLFKGNWTQVTRHLGNAVPVLMAETIAKSIAKSISKTKQT